MQFTYKKCLPKFTKVIAEIIFPRAFDFSEKAFLEKNFLTIAEIFNIFSMI